MKKISYIFLISTLIILLTGCSLFDKKDDMNNENSNTDIDFNSKVIGCDDCKYAYPSTTMFLWEKDAIDEVTDYTDDYTTLKDGDGKQEYAFLGFKNGDAKNKVYICGIEGDKTFCLPNFFGATKETFDSSVEILKNVYGEKNCEYYDGKYKIYTCRGKDTFSKASYYLDQEHPESSIVESTTHGIDKIPGSCEGTDGIVTCKTK